MASPRVCLIIPPPDHLYEVRTADGARIYIGRSVHPEIRAKRHQERWPGSSFRILVVGNHAYIADLERAFIARLKRAGVLLANVAPGGDHPPSGLGRPWTPEKRAKLEAIMRSPEYKAKMSAALKGRAKPAGHGAKVSAANIGKPKSPEHRATLSEARKGKPGHPHTIESRQKIAAANRRRVYSQEMRAKISAANARTREYRSALFRGRTFSADTRAKMSASARNRWNKTEQEARNP